MRSKSAATRTFDRKFVYKSISFQLKSYFSNILTGWKFHAIDGSLNLSYPRCRSQHIDRKKAALLLATSNPKAKMSFAILLEIFWPPKWFESNRVSYSIVSSLHRIIGRMKNEVNKKKNHTQRKKFHIENEWPVKQTNRMNVFL